jgi:ribosomal protein S18 acetylase RimI-like enzyme
MATPEVQLQAPSEENLSALLEYRRIGLQREGYDLILQGRILGAFRQDTLDRSYDASFYQRMALVDDKAVGYGYGALYNYQLGMAFLHSLNVLKGYRDQGIGSLLLEDFESNVPPGVPIRIDVGVGNGKAQRLYERHGYEVDGTGTLIKTREA